jgi:hypothetical protein
MGLQLIDFLRTMALPLDGWSMLLAFRFPCLYLMIALGSSGSLRIIVDSSIVGESGMFLVDQGKNTKNSKHLW